MALEFNVKDLLRKRPFTKISPQRYNSPIVVDDINNASYFDEKPSFYLVTQADYLRELDPNGHLIYDHSFYPDKIKIIEKEKVLPDGTTSIVKEAVQQKMVRVSFPLQEMIKTQQLIHLCGNDLHHELNSSDKETKDANKYFNKFKRGWYNKQVDSYFFKYCDSIKSTGDAAIALYMNNGKVNLKSYSFLNGDCLYFHVNIFTSEPEYFVRTFQDINNDGTIATRYAEVWDKERIYLLKQDEKGIGRIISKIKGYIGLEGYSLISSVPHGFPELPIVYYRDKDGSCWSTVQDDIDMYELGFSHLCQNNLAFAFPILVMKGDDIAIQGSDIDGAVKGFVIGADANVDYLKAPESPESFRLELETLLKNIFRGSHTIEPPEIKNGDTPTGTAKLIFFPAIQKAMKDAADLSDSIQRLSRLFKYGYSIEAGAMTQMAELDILTWAIPYIPQNDQERINNLVQEVGAGIKSKRTACEQTGDGAYNEYELLMEEQHEAQESDMLSQLRKQQEQAVNKTNSIVQTSMKQEKSESESEDTETDD